jgi:signal transduction histidine kinase
MRSMLDQTERLGRLITQLLDLSRLESGVVPLHRETVDAASLVDAVAAEARLHAPGRQVDVSVEPPELTMWVDPDRIHQVLANLTANALQFGPADRPVRIQASAIGDIVELVVTDEGSGIPEHEVDQVFERFYRADTARAGAPTGAGLGLSIVRWIVELHRGQVRAEANHPSGCSMVVRLPIRDLGAP